MNMEEYFSELDSLSKDSDTEKQITIINRRKFAKTEFALKLRRGEVNVKDIGKILSRYSFSVGINELLFDSIKPLSITDLIQIDLVNLIKRIGPLNSRSKVIVGRILDITIIDNPAEDMGWLLEILSKDERMQRDPILKVSTILIIINKLYGNKANYKTLLTKEKIKERYQVLDYNYYSLFEFFYSTIDRLGDGELSETISELSTPRLRSEESSNWGDEYNKYHSVLTLMPTNSYFKLRNIITEKNNLLESEEVSLLADVITSEYLTKTENVYETLKDLERCYGDTAKVSLKYTLNNNSYRIFDFIKRIKSEEQKNEVIEIRKSFLEFLYDCNHNFSGLSSHFIHRGLLVLIKMFGTDEEIATFIRGKTSDAYIEPHSLIPYFKCDPKNPNSYPKRKTFDLLLNSALKDRFSWEGKSSKEMDKFSFYNSHVYHVEQIILTYEMANSAKVLKKMLLECVDTPPLLGRIVESFNIKNIGFDKVLTIIEDVVRESEISRFGRKNLWNALSSSILKYADTYILKSYKRLFCPYEVLRLDNISFEVAEGYLKLAEVLKGSYNFCEKIFIGISAILASNENLNENQLVHLMGLLESISIEKRRNLRLSMIAEKSVEERSDSPIFCNFKNSKLNTLTVEEFNNMYKKVEVDKYVK